MGAPGVYNWKGSVVRLAEPPESGGSAPNVRRRRQAERRSYDLGLTIIADAEKTDAVKENDYFGENQGGFGIVKSIW